MNNNVIPIFNQDNHSVHHCVYCGGRHFTIGRHDAQCVKCEAAFPLAENNFEYKLGEGVINEKFRKQVINEPNIAMMDFLSDVRNELDKLHNHCLNSRLAKAKGASQ